MLVCAPSKAGKSSLVAKILSEANSLYTRPPGPMNYFYKIWSPTFDKLQERGIITRFIQGVCDLDWIEENIVDGDNSTVIVDDQAAALSRDVVQVFTVGSHQKDCNFFFLAQTMFSRNNPYFRDASLNSSYLILMKNPRDKSSISHLARQIDPEEPQFLVWAYHQATKVPYSHFLMDFTQECPEILRYRSNILAEGNPISVYLKEISEGNNY